MKRQFKSFHVKDIIKLKQQMLNWANRFNICCLLDNHFYSGGHNSFEAVSGVGVEHMFVPGEDFFESLSEFTNRHDDWIFGHFNYDLKNRIEQLSSKHSNGVNFPEAFLFVPQIVLQLADNQLSIGSFNNDQQFIYDTIRSTANAKASVNLIELKSRFTEAEYFAVINKLREHIRRGDCYEINFCQEFFAEHVDISPVDLFQQLSMTSPNPFAAFYKLDQLFLLCASPERYIKKEAARIISQPIKGTLRRNPDQSRVDDPQVLYRSEKERSENVMIVDLVRNDLSKICREGSVRVEELFGIYPFPQLYQMISTIIGELKPGIDFSSILSATFPMGSMTGAPKKKVMELIEKYEKTKRGLYSGTVGYITPGKDFDFNVVIRSLMYNADTGYLSTTAGGAITYNSDAEAEYKESLLKVEAIKKVLTGST